ncbi:unnamed protein product [Dovyalis caffra]|uniref:Uncharacterized protein n=1 Tax=Dovyalis caffra TaxID=77055 RepID=A0AAV1R034_9ROSI|nr:unnamed protein product [Dovyalis caffra]
MSHLIVRYGNSTAQCDLVAFGTGEVVVGDWIRQLWSLAVVELLDGVDWLLLLWTLLDWCDRAIRKERGLLAATIATAVEAKGYCSCWSAWIKWLDGVWHGWNSYGMIDGRGCCWQWDCRLLAVGSSMIRGDRLVVVVGLLQLWVEQMIAVVAANSGKGLRAALNGNEELRTVG